MSRYQSKCGLLRLVALNEDPPIEVAEVTRPVPSIEVSFTVLALGPEQARALKYAFLEWLQAQDTRPTPVECTCPPGCVSHQRGCPLWVLPY